MPISLKNLDLNLLVVFETIYSTGNISNAAKQLAMSQPAVSNALARLRELLDDPLFTRTKRGMDPTSRAHQMIGPVREALTLIRTQVRPGNEIDFATYKRLFRVMVIDSLEPMIMPAVLQAIDSNAPHIAIENIPVHPRFVEEIVSGTLDLACFAFPMHAPGIVMVPICPVDIVVIARRGHPRLRKGLDLETYNSLGHVTLVSELRSQTNIERDLIATGNERRIVYMVGKMWSIAPIVARTDLLGMLPRRFAQDFADLFGVEIHETPTAISEQYAYMMWHEKNNDEPGHTWLRERLIAAIHQEFGKNSPAPITNSGPPQPAAKAGRKPRRSAAASARSQRRV